MRSTYCSGSLAGEAVAVVVRIVRAQEPGQRHVEAVMVLLDPGEARRHHGAAVVAVVAGDDLLLARPPRRVVEVPEELDQEVVGFRPRQREVDAGVLDRRRARQPLGEVDRRVRALGGQRVVVGKLAHLRRGGFDQRLLAEAERGAPHPRHRLDVLATGLVVDVDPLAPGDHRLGTLLAVLREVGEAVDEESGVALGVGLCHRISPGRCRHRYYASPCPTPTT